MNGQGRRWMASARRTAVLFAALLLVFQAIAPVGAAAALTKAPVAKAFRGGASKPTSAPALRAVARRFARAATPAWAAGAGVQPTAAADDDIPGVPITASPTKGTLAPFSDWDDVYKVYLSNGQKLTVSMTGAAGTNFYVCLFGGASTTLDPDNGGIFLGGAADDSYPEVFAYKATKSGYYYLDAFTLETSGAGAYAITWSIENANDDIPGAALPASPVKGSLDAMGDSDDVYKVYLSKNQPLTLNMTGGAGTDFDIYIFDSSARSVFETAGLVAVANTTSYPEGGTFIAPSSGYYYFDLYAEEGSGAYTATWSTPAPTATCASQNPIAYDIRSLLTTRFRILTNQDGVTAKLTIPTKYGTKTVYSGAAAGAGVTKWTLPWDGKMSGKRLPPGTYKWTLTLTNRLGRTTTTTGWIVISNLYFTFTRTTSGAETDRVFDRYMKAANASVYISAKAAAGTSKVTVKLSGPGGFSTALAPFPCGTATKSGVTYLKGLTAPRKSGSQRFRISTTSKTTYTVSVVQ